MRDYKGLPNEEEFGIRTEHIMYTVMNSSEGINIPVHSYEAGISVIRELALQGFMARLQTKALFYVKRAYAMDMSGNWLYMYYRVWREVSNL